MRQRQVRTVHGTYVSPLLPSGQFEIQHERVTATQGTTAQLEPKLSQRLPRRNAGVIYVEPEPSSPHDFQT